MYAYAYMYVKLCNKILYIHGYISVSQNTKRQTQFTQNVSILKALCYCLHALQEVGRLQVFTDNCVEYHLHHNLWGCDRSHDTNKRQYTEKRTTYNLSPIYKGKGRWILIKRSKHFTHSIDHIKGICKVTHLDVGGICSSGKVGIDNLGLVQVTIHKLLLDKLSSCFYLTIGT